MDRGEEDQKKLTNVKNIIRSILISAQGGLTVHEFANDYESFIGEKIPNLEFGFSTVKTFLQSLDDTVQFFRSPDGFEKIRQISDDSTLHIEKMVARQKQNPKKKRGPPRTHYFSSPRARYFPAGNHQEERWVNSRQSSYNMVQVQRKIPLLSTPSLFREPPPNRFTEQNSYKTVERNLVDHNNHSFAKPESESEVWNKKSSTYTYRSANTKADSRINTTVFERPPQNEKHSVETKDLGKGERGIFDNNQHKSMHIGTEVVERNESKTLFESQNTISFQSPNSKSKPYRGRGRGRIAATQSEAKPTGQLHVRKITIPAEQSHNDQRQMPQPHYYSDIDEDDGEAKERGPVDFQITEDICEINQNVQNKVKQVLQKFPKGLWASKLPAMYRAMFKQELPLREHGFHSVIEFVSAMPHVVRTERPIPKGDWLLSDATRPREEADEFLRFYAGEPTTLHEKLYKKIMEKAESPTLPEQDEQLKESVRQVLQCHSDGVELSNFVEVYEEMTGSQLDPKAYGEKDLCSLLIMLSQQGVLHMECQGSNSLPLDSSWLFAVPSTGVCRFDYLKEGYKPHSFEMAYTGKPQDIHVPDDVVGPGVCYKAATINDLKINEYYEMHVSNIVSPGLLWVQKRKDLLSLDMLMDELDQFYSNKGDFYRMPENLMQHGQVCATLFPEDNNWHRTIMMSKVDGWVEVYYVDYGNTCFVLPSTIRFLKRKFLRLPVQAIQANLAYLLPPDGQKNFTQASKKALLDMVISKPLMAMISDNKNHILSLVLVDTNGADDIFINDQLVSKGHAKFSNKCEEVVSETGEAASTSLIPINTENQRFVRLVKITPNLSFHVINLDGCHYVASAEISSLFWEDDILASMLQQSRSDVSVSKLVVSQAQNPAVFKELVSYGVDYLDKSTEFLSLYAFEDMPRLLNLFGKQSDTCEWLKEFITIYLKNFDPNDTYWQGLGEEVALSPGISDGTGTTDEEYQDLEDVLTLKELELALRSLQINRKRILKRMTSESVCLSEDILELENTEETISKLQELIQSLEEKQTTELRVPPVEMSSDCSSEMKTVAPLSKEPTSLCKEHASNVKTNIVNPMINPSATIQEQNTSVNGLLQSSVCLEHIAASNQKLEELINQQDQMLRSMLELGLRPSVPVSNNTGQVPQFVRTANRQNLQQQQHMMLNQLQLPQNSGQTHLMQNADQAIISSSEQTQKPAVGVVHPIAGYPPHPSAFVSVPRSALPIPRLLVPARFSSSPASTRMMSVPVPAAVLQQQLIQHEMQRQQLLLQCQQQQMRLPVPTSSAAATVPSSTFAASCPSIQPAFGKFPSGHLQCPDSSLDSTMWMKTGHQPDLSSQGYFSGSAAVPSNQFGLNITEISGISTDENPSNITNPRQFGSGQLLPGMLPLLQSLKASCVVKTPHSSGSSK